jgi:hypothetical protein
MARANLVGASAASSAVKKLLKGEGRLLRLS